MTKRLSSILLLCLCSCGAKQPEVTVYVSADEYVARIIFDKFTEETNIQVNWVGDTEATKTTNLVRRLQREKESPVADVFWSSEILGTIQLANDQILSPCHTEMTSIWPTQYRGAQFQWFGFSPRARVIAYDPACTTVESLPEYWWFYTDAAVADPRFGTTGTHFAVMSTYEIEFDEFLHSIMQAPLIGGNAATVQSVIDGKVQYAMTDSDDVFAAKQRGASIDMFMPRHHKDSGGGTLMIPNTVGIIQGCPHRSNAEKFIDFMLSDEVAVLLAESPSRNYPIQPHIAALFPELQVQDPLVTDFESIVDRKDQVILESMIAIGQNSEY